MIELTYIDFKNFWSLFNYYDLKKMLFGMLTHVLKKIVNDINIYIIVLW